MSESALLGQLAQVVGAEHLLTGDGDREFYAADVYRMRELPIAVLRPGSVADLQAIVRIAAEQGVALATRGGGASYTDAHLPSTPRSLVIDSSRLNRILEINEQDMYATVEPGVTWNELWEALKPRGLRAAFWGPFSGLNSTIGGGASQNAASLGSGTCGVSADTILGFEVVLANGELMRTGAHAAANGTPFFRWYGPDLTGLFCGDSGALGIKASITLRLVRQPPFMGAASFGFDTFEQLSAGMAAAARENVTADNFGLDPKLQQGQMGSVSTAQAMAAALAVARTSRNPVDAAVRLGKMALAGQRFLAGWNFSAHYTVEGVSKGEVNGKIAVLRRVMAGHGQETANTIPTVLRAMPFVPMKVMVGPKGERWAPQHGIMPFSKVGEFRERMNRMYETYAERMKQCKVEKGAMFMALGTHAFLYEPVLYWHDELTSYHKRYLGPDVIATLPAYAANPAARELVAELRADIQAIFSASGAIHLQVGKSYPYMEGRQAAAAQALRGFKRQLDPLGIMNPGALQL
ncbi:MAG: FAD-binding oxidoreductase [Steroidobacteraceae bacterium]|nr:FAD-binding oxidoreductase [Steroidobacteraceae bacterium]